MWRRAYDEPVRVRMHEGGLTHFHWADDLYEVTELIKMVAVWHPRARVETQLWHVAAAARTGTERHGMYEIECDHGNWRLVAMWGE